MTTLSRQLEKLRVAASAQLGVERPHVSLLFGKKDAAALSNEDALKIGRLGLAHLRKVDPSVAAENDTEELFGDTALSVQRALLTNAENEKLDKSLERLLIQISPYFLHFAAQQVLEWLIYRFQIHSFNAPRVFVAFLPFHNTKIFARLLSILDLKGIEYDWVREYGKSEAPIPFERLVTKCFSANHSLLSMICQNVEDVISLFGEEYSEKNLPYFFTLYTKLGVYLVHDSTKINDTLVSKLLPFLSTSLKSKLASLRLASLMITSQLCVSVTLTQEVLHSLLKMILLKINEVTKEASVNTVILICQRQDVKKLPTKGVKKLVKKDEELGIASYIASLVRKTDLTKFFAVLWSSIFAIFSDKVMVEDDSLLAKLSSFVIKCSDVEILDGEMASSLFSLIFDSLASADTEKFLPGIFCQHIHSLVLRFGAEFDALRVEWSVRDENIVKGFLKLCKIEAHEIGDLSANIVSEKKRRRRNSSCRKSICDDDVRDAQKSIVSKKKMARKQAEAQIETLRGPLKEEFRGNPLEKLSDLINKGSWENVALGLEKVSSEKFIKRYEASDFEEFIASMVKHATTDAAHLKTNIRNALVKLPITSEFSCILLAKSSQQPVGKRARGPRLVPVDYFPNESEKDFQNRLIYVLEVLNSSSVVTASAKLLSTVFSLLKDSLEYSGDVDGSENYVQQLAISLLVRLIRNPGNYIVTKEDLQMDCVVEIVRNTLVQRVLRDCLRLLTAAVKISPSSVLSQIMSVFTFMGSGLLRKDNDLTLGIIEETLGVLFAAVMSDNDKVFNERLVSVSRIFAASVVDIPAHRRLRILHAVSKASTFKHLWAVIAVLFEQYCLSWQRNTYNKGRTNVEQFEEMATEMVSLYNGAEQLLCAINLVDYVVYMGGDKVDEDTKRKPNSMSGLYEELFNRSKHSVQKLRHYRFAIIGWIARLLSSKELFEKLTFVDDEEMYAQLVEIGKRLLVCSLELDEFVTTQSDEKQILDTQNEPSALKYWAAITSRADIVAEKFRNLLPASVSGRLIADTLADVETEPKMRDRALQLLNVKLMQDGLFHRDGGIRPEHLVQFAQKLIGWIKPVESKDEIVLCQNAAYSLRLLVRRMQLTEGASILAECIRLCKDILKQWRSLDEALVGNVFLLVAEIFKYHSMRATLLASNSTLPVCIEVINQQIEYSSSSKNAEKEENMSSQGIESRGARRKRVAQQSMSGRRIGGDALLVCGLTCLQRILDQFANYVSAHFPAVLLVVSRLSARYDPRFEIIGRNDKSSLMKTYPVQSRICQIRKALAKAELRVILGPFENACLKLLKEPKAMVFLFSTYSACIEGKDHGVIVKALGAFCDFMFTAFRLRAMNPTPEVYEVTTDCEARMISSLFSIIDCLSENELHPVMINLHKWVDPIVKMPNNINTSHLVSVFNILNGFYDSYNALALPHIGRFFEMVLKILRRMNGRSTDVESLLFFGKKGTFEALEGNSLITFVIDLIAKCAKHPEFFTVERAQLVLEPLVEELENSVMWGHEERCCPHLADCLFNIADTHSDIMADMFAKIMLKTRSVKPKIRYRALLVLERMFGRMGEAVAPLLPSVLPFLSELLEDENKKVEEQCDRVLNVIRKNFGEEIADSFV